MDDTPKKAKSAAPGNGVPNPPRRPARAELVWEGKYDAAGRRAAPLRVALPFQTVETVNESAQDRQRNLQFGLGFREEEWRNRLIWGDKKYVLPSLLPEFAGKVNLIYIDPPFDTGADFSFTATVPNDPETPGDDSFSFTKEPSIIEHKAYRDTWGRGLESYLQWFYETAALLHELLHETGSIYVHLDENVGHYAKVILDGLFGRENFRNHIVVRSKPSPTQMRLNLVRYTKAFSGTPRARIGRSTTFSLNMRKIMSKNIIGTPILMAESGCLGV
jgi:DNA methylase